MDIRSVGINDCTDRVVGRLNELMHELSADSRAVTRKELQNALQNKNFILFIAEEEKNIVGTATIFFAWRPEGKELAEMHDLVVDESCRGKGIGKQLLEHALALVQQRAIETQSSITVALTSKPKRVAANALYMKLGFELVSAAVGERGTNLYRLTIKP